MKLFVALAALCIAFAYVSAVPLLDRIARSAEDPIEATTVAADGKKPNATVEGRFGFGGVGPYGGIGGGYPIGGIGGGYPIGGIGGGYPIGGIGGGFPIGSGYGQQGFQNSQSGASASANSFSNSNQQQGGFGYPGGYGGYGAGK